jgi:F-type H+-transporting ATPase subunit c
MKKYVSLALVILGLLVFSVGMVQAQGSSKTFDATGKVTSETAVPTTTVLSGPAAGAGLGIALTMLGAGLGFGRIGSAALESMARQPEKAGQIQGAMITVAALLEGATFFALLVCLLLVTARAGF